PRGEHDPVQMVEPDLDLDGIPAQGQLLLELPSDGQRPVAETVALRWMDPGPELFLLHLGERRQVFGEQEALEFAVLMQPSFLLGLIRNRARQRAGKPFRLEPRSEGTVAQVWLVLGGLARLRPQAERFLDANRHRLPPLPSPNATVHLPADAASAVGARF